MTRTDILNLAWGCIDGDRDQYYGEPEDNFSVIAKFWSVYLGKEVSAIDVAMMMVLLKTARARGTATTDSFVDIAGYAACAGEIFGREAVLGGDSE